MFGPEVSSTPVVDLSHLIVASPEEKLDPASQTGDFVLPRDNDGKVFDLTHEELRIYHYPDGSELEVDNPVQLSIGPDGSHQITPHDRVGITAPPGWIKIEHFPKFGGACFPGHIPVVEIGD